MSLILLILVGLLIAWALLVTVIFAWLLGPGPKRDNHHNKLFGKDK